MTDAEPGRVGGVQGLDEPGDLAATGNRRHLSPLEIAREVVHPRELIEHLEHGTGPRRRPRRRPRRGTGPGSDSGHGTAIVDCALYERGERQHGELPYSGALDAAQSCDDGFVWIGMFEPSQQEFAGVAAEFGLHPLAVEDAVKAHQRPKLERYGDTLFVVLKSARYVEQHAPGTADVIETGEVMLFLGANFVVTVRHGGPRRLDTVRHGLEGKPDLLRHGPFAVLYAVADRVVDDYLEVTEAFQDDVDEVETQVFAARGNDGQRVYGLKRELLEFRRAAVPLARPLNTLTCGAVPGLPAAIREYFRDIEDHLHRVTDQVTGFDELLNGILQANLAQVTVQQNNDMRKISAWVAILAVPTMIAGIYGMNFEHMPELSWRFGYPFTLVLMALICAVLYVGFRRNHWL